MIKQIVSNGECQHFVIISGRAIWSTRDECHFCGTGKEWK